nr:unnamed protein product [Callosobruchus analis]
MVSFAIFLEFIYSPLSRMKIFVTKAEFLDFKANSTVEDNFQLLTLEKCCLKRYNPCVAALVSIKTNQRSRLNIEGDLRVALP